MGKININELKDDILDRMDNSVIGQELPEQMRQKLKSPQRILRAMNQAVSLFVKDADAASLTDLQEIVSLTADSNIGTSGTVNSVTTYQWPDTAYAVRPDGGLMKVIMDDEEHYFDQRHNSPLESVRFQADNSLYGNDQPVFHVDISAKRIYIPEGITAEAFIITQPDSITYSDPDYQYDAGSELPIDEVYAQTLSELALAEMRKMSINFQNRERVINDTMQGAPQSQPQQQQQKEQQQ